MQNILAASRCMGCNARRPASLVRLPHVVRNETDGGDEFAGSARKRRAASSARVASARKVARGDRHVEGANYDEGADDAPIVLTGTIVTDDAAASAHGVGKHRRRDAGGSARPAVQAEAEGWRLYLSRTNGTGYTGVSFDMRTLSRGHLYVVYRHCKFLGRYPTAIEAAVAFARHMWEVEGTTPDADGGFMCTRCAISFESASGLSKHARTCKELAAREAHDAESAVSLVDAAAAKARAQAAAEGLTLFTREPGRAQGGESATIFRNVYQDQTPRASLRPYRTYVTRDGRQTILGYFETAEEAALCFARSPEGRAWAAKVDAIAAATEQVPATAAACHEQAAAEGLVLLPSRKKSGFRGVVPYSGCRGPALVNAMAPGMPMLYSTMIGRKKGKTLYRGRYELPEQAALVYARTPEGRADAAEAARVLTPEQAYERAAAEGLELLRSTNASGFAYVNKCVNGRSVRYQCMVRDKHLGNFASAEEGALCLARQVARGAVQLPLSWNRLGNSSGEGNES